jgi:hypothetical protein
MTQPLARKWGKLGTADAGTMELGLGPQPGFHRSQSTTASKFILAFMSLTYDKYQYLFGNRSIFILFGRQ